MTEDESLSVPQVARELGVSDATIRQLIDSGELRAYSVLRRWRVRRSALSEYIASHSNQPQEEQEES